MVLNRFFRTSSPSKPADSVVEVSEQLRSGAEVAAVAPSASGQGASGGDKGVLNLPVSSTPDQVAQSLSRIQEALSEASKPLPVSAVVEPPRPPAPSPGLTPAAANAAATAFKARDISLFKSLLSGLYDGVLIMDAKGAVINSNRRAEHFLGYTEQELWGMQCEELIVGINTRVLYKLHAHAEEGRFTVVNATCKRKDGTTFPAEIAISRIRLLNEGDLIFSVRNIERREKVREHRGLEEEAMRSTGASVAVCSIDGAIEFANPAFVRLLGLTDDQDVLKHMIGDFCSSYEQVNAMMHAPSSQGNWLGTLELVTPKGGKREVLATAALSQLHRGAAARIVLTMIPVPKAVVKVAPKPGGDA